MSGPIQTFPLGLVSLLGLKGGDFPNALSQQVSPTLDLTAFYLLQQREVLALNTVAGAVLGNNNVLGNSTVPSGEQWYVWNFQVTATLAAATAIVMAPSMFTQGNAFVMGGQVGGVALEEVRSPVTGPYWMRAGDQCGVFVKSITGVVNVGGVMLISRLRV
jgi:hypothetical protein